MAERAHIPLACIMPLALERPLLTAPYLSPASAYTLLSARNTAWNWDAPLAPLMIWLRASLYQTCPGLKSPSPFIMADHILVGRQNLHRQLVPCISEGPDTPAPTYIFYQAQQVSQAAPSKKKSPA